MPDSENNFTTNQQRFIDSFVNSYQEKMAGSSFVAEASQDYQYTKPYLNVEVPWQQICFPLIVRQLESCYMTDIDGNQYINCADNGLIASYRYREETVKSDSSNDHQSSPKAVSTDLDKAKIVSEVTGSEKVFFCHSDSLVLDFICLALRQASGKKKLLVFSSDDQGGFILDHPVDSEVIPLELCSPASIEFIQANADDIMGVMVDPLSKGAFHYNSVQFVKDLALLLDKLGLPLIFDERWTGFRYHHRGAQLWFGITADLSIYNDIFDQHSNSIMIVGKAEYILDIQNFYANDKRRFSLASLKSQPSALFQYHIRPDAFSGTIRNRLKHANTNVYYQKINRSCALFCERVNLTYQKMGAPIEWKYFGSLLIPVFIESKELKSLFYLYLRFLGVYVDLGKPLFIGFDHHSKVMDHVLNALVAAVDALQKNSLIPCKRKMAAQYTIKSGEKHFLTANKSDSFIKKSENQVLAFALDCEDLNKDVMRAAWKKLVQYQDSLRISLDKKSEKIAIDSFVDTEPDYRQSPLILDEVVKELESFDFNGGKAPLVRLVIFKDLSGKLYICVCAHPLNSGKWVLMSLLRELGVIYTWVDQGHYLSLQPKQTLKRISDQLDLSLEEENWSKSKRFWLSEYASVSSTVELVAACNSEPHKYLEKHTLRFLFDDDVKSKIYTSLDKFHVKPYDFFLTAYVLLLHKISDSVDFILGIPTVELDRGVLSSNSSLSVPLRVRLRPEADLSTLLSTLSFKMQQLRLHHKVFTDNLIQELLTENELPEIPFVNVLFNFQCDEERNILFSGKPAKKVYINYQDFQHQMIFNLHETERALSLELDYAKNLFDSDVVTYWIDLYQSIVMKLIDSMSAKAPVLSLLSEVDETGTNAHLIKDPSVRIASDEPIVDNNDDQEPKDLGGKHELINPIRAPKNVPVPLTATQSFVINQIRVSQKQGQEKALSAFNRFLFLELTGSVNKSQLNRALIALLQRHPILGATFGGSQAGCSLKPTNKTSQFKLNEADFSQCKDAEFEEKYLDYLNSQCMYEFSIFGQSSSAKSCPLFRAHLIKQKDDRWLLLLVIHYLLVDQISLKILYRDFSHLYYHGLLALKPSLPVLEYDFFDYAYTVTNEEKVAEALAAPEDLVPSYLDIEPLALPVDWFTDKANYLTLSKFCVDFPDELFESVERWSSAQGVSKRETFLAAFAWMLHLLSKQDEYLFLCKLPNRQEGYKQNMVGLFEQVLPIHVKLGAKNSMNGFMEYIRQQINRSERGLNAQSFLSKDKLFEKLNKCLSPVFFCYQETTAIDPCDFPDTNVRILDPELVVSNVELSFDMNVIGCNSSNVRKIEISYANNIFSESSIIKWVEYYLDILKAWVKLVPIIDRDENILEMLSIEEESSVCIPEENNSIYIENDDFAQGEQRVDQDLSSGPPDACQIDLGDDALDFQEDDSDPNHARQFNNGRSKVISWLKGRMM